MTDAIHIQRAIGSRSPSLAVATTMHHFSVASLVELTATSNGFEWAMLDAIAPTTLAAQLGIRRGQARTAHPAAHDAAWRLRAA